MQHWQCPTARLTNFGSNSKEMRRKSIIKYNISIMATNILYTWVVTWGWYDAYTLQKLPAALLLLIRKQGRETILISIIMIRRLVPKRKELLFPIHLGRLPDSRTKEWHCVSKMKLIYSAFAYKGQVILGPK